jgi:putative endonuclease
MLFVYAIYNAKNNKIYIGQTTDLSSRLMKHNKKIFKDYTSKFDGNWEVVFQEELDSRSGALKRERQLKSFRGRESVWKIIKTKYSRVAQR